MAKRNKETATSDSTALVERKKELQRLLEQAKQRIADVLPKYMTPERTLRLVLLAAHKTPKLYECDPLTVVNAVIQACQLNLEIGRQAHLVPFWNDRAKVMECQMIPDYRGILDLVRRTGDVAFIDTAVVYAKERFVYEKGAAPKLEHVPDIDGGPYLWTDIRAAYAVAYLREETRPLIIVLPKWELEKVRNSSRAKDSGPWQTWAEEQCKKTALKRISKLLPQSVELATAIELDNRAETGEFGTILDEDTEERLSKQAAAATARRAEELREKMKERQNGEATKGLPEQTGEPVPEAPQPAEPVPVERHEGQQPLF